MRIDEVDNMPELIMMIGVPGVGKSTWIQNHMTKNPSKNYAVVSSDDIIEELGRPEGLSYAEAFKKFSGFAMKEMDRRAKEYFAAKRNIIWDQTNLNPKARKGKLAQAVGYRKIAVVFSLTDAERERRYEKRKAESGKTIPAEVISNMLRSFQAPTKAEGFEQIINVRD
jgi:predicted kinase